MVEEKKTNEECCSTSGSSSGCCGGKKFIMGVLVGLILTAAAFGFYSVGQCAAKGKMGMCPITGAPMQQMQK